MDNKFVKLSALVGSSFKVTAVNGYQWKMWSPTENKMLVSDVWKEGYKKLYAVDTDQGTMDMSQSQMGNMLEGVSRNGQANIVGNTFSVKSNNKTGIEIRYFLRPVKDVIDNPLEDPFY